MLFDNDCNLSSYFCKAQCYILIYRDHYSEHSGREKGVYRRKGSLHCKKDKSSSALSLCEGQWTEQGKEV